VAAIKCIPPDADDRNPGNRFGPAEDKIAFHPDDPRNGTTHGNRKMKNLILSMILLLSSPAYAAPAHPCSADAVERAKKLLALHFGQDDRIEIDPSVSVIKPIKNPASKSQIFDVLEVWGNIYKGQYRMRFIYARQQKECVLMGQEIIEYAKL
jgi:hypothetical protein